MVQTNNELKSSEKYKSIEEKKAAKENWLNKNVPLIIGLGVFGFLIALTLLMRFTR
jgi:uncharacterized membrane protein